MNTLSTQKKTKFIAEDLGRLFEVGFNIGILTFIKQKKIKNNFGKLYEEDLTRLKFNKIKERIIDNAKIIDLLDKEKLGKWIAYFLQKGFLSGLNFFQEYLKSFNYKLDKVEIIYYQANFCDEYNSFGLINKPENDFSKDLLNQFSEFKPTNEQLLSIINQYKKTGEFLKADTLILLRYRQREWRILCLDLSIFSIQEAEDIKDLHQIEIIRQLLLKEISYLRSKSVFSRLNIDTGKDNSQFNFNFPESLINYFSAFKRDNKETAKLIQASGYSYSFYQFLTKFHPIQNLQPEKIRFNIMGYSDRGISAISLTPNNLEILKTCQTIYQKHERDEDINQAKQKVFRNIKNKTATCFNDGKKFIKNLESNIQLNTINYTEHQETITDFVNSIAPVSDSLLNQLNLPLNLEKRDLRNVHAKLIYQALTNSNPYLFLTGNPGIGKTTAIVNFLIDYFDDGFLFLYISPRTQVNLDAIAKFNKVEKKGIFCLNTNSNIIRQNGSNQCTVSYSSDIRNDDFTENNVDFINSNNLEKIQNNPNFISSLYQPYEDTFQDKGEKSKGVLNSICTAIQTLIKHDISRNIVATVAIQSLKVTSNNSGDNTLKHLQKIFTSVCNRDGIPIPKEMQRLRETFKHIFIMIDEITGDDSGVEFLNGIRSTIINKNKLIENGINAKIIVADASLISSETIQEHLTNKNPEPDKIFYRQTTENLTPIWVEEFDFKRKPATLINANSYPAKSLNISYKIFLQSVKLEEDLFFKQKSQADKKLRSKLQSQITEDIKNLLNNPNSGQIIVYIQDKARLQELIIYLKEQFSKFNIYEEYLEIHANISDVEKQNIKTYSNEVKIIFMTASGCRGLSFPKTKHILVDIPRFAIEKNLMEIIQVIYRGRGNYNNNGQEKSLDNEDKELIFYISEQVIYSEKYSEFSNNNMQKNLLNIIDLLLILKTAIMTRISGCGKIGKHHYMMIPIGGKSVSMAGETYTAKIVSLLRELKNESRRNPSHQQLKQTYTQLKQLLSKVDITIKTLNDSQKSTNSYLSIRNSFTQKFSELTRKNLAQLLTFNTLEDCHINGSLLIVPLANKNVNENYLMRLKKEFNHNLLTTLKSIQNNPNYHQNLRNAVHYGIELVNKSLDSDKSYQYLEQNSKRFDRYYSIPLFTFICREIMEEYFNQNVEPEDDKENINFHTIIKLYLSSLFPISSVLPIGINYEKFPFLVFNSYSLNQIRNQIFTDTQLLNSSELNVLNLILSQP